jgi:uncharacterized protein (DUF3820 family)
MSTQSPKVVPFGKYKGQPIEVLAQDRQYLDWLTAQDWFRDRHAGIYTLIVNNFTEASETPDHNALQVLFLDNAFCDRFIAFLDPDWKARAERLLSGDINTVLNRLTGEQRWSNGERKSEIEASINRLKTAKRELWFSREFEVGRGVDVALQGYIGIDDGDCRGSGQYRIELKPSVGDDYPAILRQMRASHSNVLLTRDYTGAGATEEQFVKTFATADIKVVFLRDVEAPKPT